MSRFEDRLAEKIDRLSSKECWEWQGATNNNGYGVITKKINEKWKLVLAHRAAFSIHLGRPIKKSLSVCHSCDNPLCCNPDHLFEATHKENMKDMSMKGRTGRTPKLTDRAVKKIRRLYAAGANQYVLAQQFQVAQSQISRIVNRKTWKHL